MLQFSMVNLSFNNLKKIRKDKRLTLQQLAERVGTSHEQIRKLENGERRLTVDWMVRIGKALDVPPSMLMNDTTPRDISNARTRALLLAEALAQKQPEQVRQKLSAILDQELKTMGAGMTPESFVKFFIESRQMGVSDAPAVDKTKKKPTST